MSKLISTMAGTAALCAALSIGGAAAAEAGEPLKKWTPEAMMSLYRIGSQDLSPDGKLYVYTRSLPNVEENNSSSDLLVGHTAVTGDARVILAGSKGHSPAFIENDLIAYISTEGDHAQLALIKPDGSEKRVISDFDFSVEGFLFSPDRSRVMVWRKNTLPTIREREYPELDKATGQIYDDLMYKHWDEWNTYTLQPYIATVAEAFAVSREVTPVLPEGELFEAPTKPFSGAEDFAWSPDGTKLLYSCRKKMGLEYAVSTNTDIYRYDLTTRETVNLTEGMPGYDTMPAYSPDGRYISWVSMERDGYEADLKRLFLLDTKTGKKTFLSKDYDNYVDSYQWLDNGKGIRFQSNDYGLASLFEIDLKGKVTRIYKPEMADVAGFVGGGDLILFGRQSFKEPTDLYLLQKGQVRKLTTDNDAFLAGFSNITIEERWMETTNGEKMLVWVVFPPNFDPSKKYPAILYCQGGPQDTVSQFWSYRWNIRTFVSEGFIFVMPNRHGVPGFGHAWNEQISGDYGGQNMRDYFTAIDTVAREPYVDAERLGATGASYGGFSIYWIAGHHEGRFKALMAHAGIFNLEAQYLETEEKWFANWDMGGAYWDKDNAVAQNTFANSPHRFVDKWTAPILISHGDYDFRIVSTQGMQAFDAAKMRGIPARLVYYPDESHWILKPQNGLLFYHTWFDWMNKYLKY